MASGFWCFGSWSQENAFFDAEITEIHEKKVFFARLEFESYL